MAGSPPILHMMVLRRARIQDVLKVKVKVKGHVIRTLFWFHENRFFSQANGWIATKLAHDGPQAGLHPGCSQGQGQGQRSRDADTFFVISQKSLFLAGKWLERYQTCTWWFPARCASMCAQGQGRGQRSRDTGTSVMSRNVCYTVRATVLSLHALTLWNTIILSFQYQAPRCLNIGMSYSIIDGLVLHNFYQTWISVVIKHLSLNVLK